MAHHPHRGWSIPSGRAPTTHILKPAIRALLDHDLNELLCIRAAVELGLAAEEADLGHFGDQRALVVRRYDRVVDAHGDLVRLHQEDFCQALSVHPNRKYQSEGGPSVDDLVAVLRAHSTSPQRDLQRLLDAVAYHWLILGTDAHAKNYSLILSGQQVRLAPLYDAASAAPYVAFAPKAKLAQKVGGEYRAGQVTARQWGRLAAVARLDQDEVVARVADLAARLPAALERAVAGLDLRDDEQVAAGELAERVLAWTATAGGQLGGSPRVAGPPTSTRADRRPPARHPSGTTRGGRFARRPPTSTDEA